MKHARYVTDAMLAVWPSMELATPEGTNRIARELRRKRRLLRRIIEISTRGHGLEDVKALASKELEHKARL